MTDCIELLEAYLEAEEKAEDAWKDTYDEWEDLQDESGFWEPETAGTAGGGVAIGGGIAVIIFGGPGTWLIGGLAILGGGLGIWGSESERQEDIDEATDDFNEAMEDALNAQLDADRLWCKYADECIVMDIIID
jgi:hypothetical protein